MWNHRIVVRVRVLLDVEVLLYFATGIGEKGPLLNRGPEVVHGKDGARGDSDDLRVSLVIQF